MLNNNFLRILVSGGIATLLQRSLGLNPISLEGFVFFLLIFSTVSYFWIFVFPKKKKELSQEEKEKLIKQKELDNKIYFAYVKKSILIVCSLICLNIIVNFLSFKTGLFDDSFKYRFDTKKAIALNLDNENFVKDIQLYDEFYSLYKKDGKYFLVQKNEETNKYILTLYSSFYISDIFDNLKDEENFLDILENISPTLYKEITLQDFIFKPLWFFNNSKDIYWLSEDIEFYKNEYKKYIEQKKAKAKEEKYKSLLNKDLQNLSEIELFNLLRDIYKISAFTEEESYLIAIFNELDKRDKNKTKDLNIDAYRFALLAYFHLYKTKVELNYILKKYEKGVVYAFDFWDLKPDVNIKFSHARFVNLKSDEVTVFYQENLQNIEILGNEIILFQKDGTKISLGFFEKEDLETIKNKLSIFIRDIYLVQNIYNKLK